MISGDPASTSALGGALRSNALRLADLVDELSPTAHAAQAGRPDHVAGERQQLGGAAHELDRVGALLQQWTATTVDSLTRLRQLDHQLAAAGLEVAGNKVVESLGPSRVDPDERLRSRERLQELLNRVTSARAKELAGLARELEASRATLARLPTWPAPSGTEFDTGSPSAPSRVRSVIGSRRPDTGHSEDAAAGAVAPRLG